jgi:hypothetical protein
VDSDAADSHLPTANGGGGGDATPANSGADASVRLAGRTSSTQLKKSEKSEKSGEKSEKKDLNFASLCFTSKQKLPK